MRFLIPVVLATALCAGFLFVLLSEPGVDTGPDGARAGARGGSDTVVHTDGADDDVDLAHADDGDDRGRSGDPGARRGTRGNDRTITDRGTRNRGDRGADVRRGSRGDAARRTGGTGETVDRGGRGDRRDADRSDRTDANDRQDRNRPWDDDEAGENPAYEYVDIAGTVVVRDLDGTEYSEEDGTFTAMTRVGARYVRATVEFEEGKWTARVPEGGELEVRDLRAGGRGARVDGKRQRIEDGAEIAIVANWSKIYLLRVLGDEEQELRDVDVVTNPLRAAFQHPGDLESARVLVESEPSPIDVASHGDPRFVWVWSPGYAWERVDIPVHQRRQDREEKVVKLTRSATATVTLDNFTPDSGSRLRIRPASRNSLARPYTEFDLDVYLDTAYGDVPLVGFRPGNYSVSVEVGDHDRSPTVLARENLTIDRYEERSVHLVLNDAPVELEPVTLGGTLLLPTAAVDATVVLNVEPLELFSAGQETRRSVPRQDMEEEAEGTLLWNVGSVLPGRYTVEVEPFQYREIITVEEDSSTEVRIEIPELAEITLCAVDEDSRDAVVLTSLSWQAKPPSGVTRQSFRSARLDEESGCYTVLAPEGEITVSFSGSGVRRQYKKFDVVAGRNDIEIEVSVDPGIRVRLLDDTTAVAITSHTSVSVQEVGGAGRRDWWSLRNGILEIYVSNEGLYEVSFASIPGYEPVAAQEIQVIDGKIVDLEVQVQPRQ